jgi:nitrite reductase/ring-hydroxylating ferredoxin subunit
MERIKNTLYPAGFFSAKGLFSGLLIASIFLGFSCKKQNNQRIPYVPVNAVIYISDPVFNRLNVVGGWAYINGGSRGIIVYRRGQDDFVSFDRHCTFEPENSCGKVSVNNTQIQAVDSCCGSEFILSDGTATKGPATIPLQEYITSFDGQRVLISN